MFEGVDYERLKEENEKLQKRIKELEAELKEYGNHKDSCAYIQGLKGQAIEECNCGFEQALKG